MGFLLEFLNFPFPVFCWLEFSSVILIILSCLELISTLYSFVCWFVFSLTSLRHSFTSSLRCSHMFIIPISKFQSCFSYSAFSGSAVVGFLGSGGYILSHLLMVGFVLESRHLKL